MSTVTPVTDVAEADPGIVSSVSTATETESIEATLSISEARTRDPGREVIKKFLRRHGYLTMVSLFVSAGWAELMEKYLLPGRDEWYVMAVRMAMSMAMGWISYTVLFRVREVGKIIYKTIRRYITECCDKPQEEDQVPEDNVSSNIPATCSVTMDNVSVDTDGGTQA